MSRPRFSVRTIAVVSAEVAILIALWTTSLPFVAARMVEASLIGFNVIWLATRRFAIASPILLLIWLWILFGYWEKYCQAQQANIRVDLLMLYPAFSGLTLLGAVYMLAVLLDAWTCEPPSRSNGL